MEYLGIVLCSLSLISLPVFLPKKGANIEILLWRFRHRRITLLLLIWTSAPLQHRSFLHLLARTHSSRVSKILLLLHIRLLVLIFPLLFLSFVDLFLKLRNIALQYIIREVLNKDKLDSIQIINVINRFTRYMVFYSNALKISLFSIFLQVLFTTVIKVL